MTSKNYFQFVFFCPSSWEMCSTSRNIKEILFVLISLAANM